MKTKIYWIAKTAVFIALLVALQALTKPAGILLTGSVVNLVLILSVVLGGFGTGLSVAIISPLMAALLGIAPNWGLVPFIALGNIAIVAVWFILTKVKLKPLLTYIVAAVVGAAVKFGVLWVSVVQVGVPLILKLPEKQAVAISAQFGINQLFTALIGGAVACIILPLLVKTIGNMEKRAGFVKTA
ncbi:MAG: hypothetical protein LBL98_00745 [Ruminococcus sp.]|jgi:hypothetical protein|nr:hypothetical protein [Ruminococcus sp.]